MKWIILAMKWIKWLFWYLWYLPQSQPKDLKKWLVRSFRTKSPWWIFKPHVNYNEIGRQWEVWFEDGCCYSKEITIPATAHIDNDTGRIIGLTVRCKNLVIEE